MTRLGPVNRFFWLLVRSPVRVPDRAYYWLLDRLTDNGGWRPLHMRYPEHCTRDRRTR